MLREFCLFLLLLTSYNSKAECEDSTKLSEYSRKLEFRSKLIDAQLKTLSDMDKETEVKLDKAIENKRIEDVKLIFKEKADRILEISNHIQQDYFDFAVFKLFSETLPENLRDSYMKSIYELYLKQQLLEVELALTKENVNLNDKYVKLFKGISHGKNTNESSNDTNTDYITQLHIDRIRNKKAKLLEMLKFWESGSEQNKIDKLNECKFDGMIGDIPDGLCYFLRYTLNKMHATSKMKQLDFQLSEAKKHGWKNIAKQIAKQKEKFLAEHGQYIKDQYGNNLLLYGPQGNGKSTYAEKFASVSGAEFLKYSASTIMNKYVGESAKNIRNIFQEAIKKAEAGKKVVIFIDVIDVLFFANDNSGYSEYLSAAKELAVQLDGIRKYPQITFICATDNFNSLSLHFKSRTQQFEIPKPSAKLRRKILEHFLSRRNIYIEDIPWSLWFFQKPFYNSKPLTDAEKKLRKKELLDLLANKTNGLSIRSLEKYISQIRDYQYEKLLDEASLLKLIPKY